MLDSGPLIDRMGVFINDILMTGSGGWVFLSTNPEKIFTEIGNFKTIGIFWIYFFKGRGAGGMGGSITFIWSKMTMNIFLNLNQI